MDIMFITCGYMIMTTSEMDPGPVIYFVEGERVSLDTVFTRIWYLLNCPFQKH